MDARDETALIDAYERAVGTCKLDKSTTAASEEERRVPHKDTAGPQQRLSVHRCPQPCSEPSPEQEQHEEQVLESDGIGSSQPEENESDGTGTLRFPDVFKRKCDTNLPFIVTLLSHIQMMATLCQ